MKDNYWLKSGLINVVQNFSSVFFNFISFYLLIKLLSKHDFGAWTLFLSTTTILELVRSGLIQNALIKFVSSADQEEHPKILSSSIMISGGLTIFCIVLNLSLAHYLGHIWDSPELAGMFYLYNIGFVLSGALTVFNCLQQAHMKFNQLFITNFIRLFTFFLYVTACYFWGYHTKLIYLVYLQILSLFVCTVLAYIYVKHYFKVSWKIYPDWIKRLFNYGKYAFGTSVSASLSNTMDQMMLGALLSPSASASFNIAVRITNLVDIPTNAVAAIVFPQSSKRMETDGKEAIKYLYEKSVGTLLAILIPGLLFLYLFAGFVVHLIAGGKYDDSIPLLKITLLYSLLIPYGRQFGTILDSIGKTKLTFIIVLITASTNLTLNYLFISHLGVLGAAYATLVANVIGFLIAQSILRKELRISIFNTFIYAYRFYPEMYHKFLKKDKSNN